MSQTLPPLDIATADWRESWAYLIGMQAFAYGYPTLYYTKLRFGMVRQPVGVISAPLNTLFHIPRLSSHEEQYGGSPMRDGIYSIGWLDVRDEPVVVYAPDCADRYVSIQLAEFYSDLFGYAGPSVNGGKAQTALVVGPNWNGETPKGIDAVLRSPTPNAFMVARVSSPGGDDLAAARALQQQIFVKPLSNWLNNTPTPDKREVMPPADLKDPLADFATMNAAMRENPPPARDEALMRQFARVGLGPLAEKPLAELDEATRRGLLRVLQDGPKLLLQVARSGGDTKQVDGWFYGDRNWGRMAAQYDFLGRASPQAFSGIVEHWIEQSTKLRTFVDADGEELTGAHRYTLHFKADEIPQAEAFWSITLYDERYNMVDNPIKRYGVSSLVGGLVRGADDSLTVYLQHKAPTDPDQLANWLPTPEGKFNLFLRTYLPGPSVQDQSYAPPPVRRVR